MNQWFVNVKVDSEQRPDLDRIYMLARQIMTGQGGWPNNLFLTPDLKPFYAGSYFPPKDDPRAGPGFPTILASINQGWTSDRTQVLGIAENVMNAMRRIQSAMTGNAPAPINPGAWMAKARDTLLPQFDPQYGGFADRSRTKFPNAPRLALLLSDYEINRTSAALSGVLGTLDAIAFGGIHDHLAGGFHRYSTEPTWSVPHFEKMLYDNAQLVDLLTLVWQETKSLLYATRVAETCDWVLREMVADGGGFAATYDADSEGVEGKFYVWDAAEIDAVLGTADSAFFRAVYDVTADGNWEHHNILHRNRAPALLSEGDEQRLAALRVKLKAVRDKRVWPGWDDKVLADWNGLMIAALTNASAVFQRDDWLAAAVRAWRFVMDGMRDDHGRLFHSRRAGKSLHRATLDDYANMARAGVALFEATGETPYLGEVQALIAVLDRRFADRSGGGYFITADDAADLIVRNKHCHDNAVPSGNGTLAGVFARLWVLSGDATWHDKAQRQVAAFAGELEGNFFPLMTLLNGYETLQGATELVLVGDPATLATEALRRAVYARSLPNKIVRRLKPGTALSPGHPAAGKGLVGGKPALYVCRNMSCEAPVTDPRALRL